MQRNHWAAALGWSLVVVLALGACSRSPAATPAKPAAADTAAAQPAAPAAAPAAPAAPTAADDQAVAEFYRGRVVRLIVGLPAGGGYDAYARNIARVMGKYIPGNPTIVVENMAGASSVVASNHVYNIAPKDGSVILHYQGTVIPQQAFGARGIEFDALKFQHLGAPAHDTTEFNLARRAGITRFDELLGPNGREVVLGGIAPGALTDDVPKLLKEVLGARLKLVSGYAGTAPVRIAIDGGELDGFFNAWESTKITNLADIESGNWLVLLQFTDRPHPDLPNVPTINEFTRTEEQRQLMRFGALIPGQFTRPFAVAPGVPADRVRALREAFAKTMADEDFLAAAEKGKMAIEPQTGEEIQKLMEEYFTMPEDIKNRLRDILLVS
jgi:tripartite-type tricarboxylate transporter receptor subunit TctC